jgi:hypothetical protein
MSFHGLKLEGIALFTLALVFARTKDKFQGRPFWVRLAHLGLYGLLAVMAAGGLRLLLYLCMKPKLFFEVFAQQELFRMNPRVMVVFGVLFALSSLWFFWYLDDVGQLRNGATRAASWVAVAYCASYPIIMAVNFTHLRGYAENAVSWTLLFSVATLGIGVCARAFYRSRVIAEILLSGGHREVRRA